MLIFKRVLAVVFGVILLGVFALYFYPENVSENPLADEDKQSDANVLTSNAIEDDDSVKALAALPAEDFPDEHDEEYNAFLEYLNYSSHPDDQLLALVLKQSAGEDRIAELRGYLGSYPDNSLALFLIAEESLASSIWAEVELTRLKLLEPNNAIVDDMLAKLALGQGDKEKALEQLDRASKATRHSDYTAELIGMVGSAYIRKDGYLSAKTALNAVGIAMARDNYSVTAAYELCRENEMDLGWLESCVSRGVAMFHTGTTLLDRGIGIGLLRRQVGEEDDRVVEYSIQFDQVRQLTEELTPIWEAKFNDSDLTISEVIWMEYIRVYNEKGEAEAEAAVYLLEALSES